MTHGRPLRFLALVLAAWVASRVALLWSADAPRDSAAVSATQDPLGPIDLSLLTPPATLPGLAPPAPSPAASPPREGAAALPPTTLNAGSTPPLAPLVSGEGQGPIAMQPVTTRGARQSVPVQPGAGFRRGRRDEGLRLALDEAPTAVGQEATSTGTPAILAAHGSPPTSPSPASRLRVDAWLIARSGSSGDNLAFGQLGASQAGLRLTYAFDRDRRLALSARATAPLRGPGHEAALGLDWRPTSLPLHLLVEERLPLDGGPARPAAQLIGGGAARLPFGWSLEGYAQAGGVYRRGGFADSSARLTRLLATRGWFAADLGVGGWGAAQRGVARLDVGPTLGVTLPVGRGAVRLAVDYRRRVAGRARPGSGPVLSLGAGF